MRTRGMAALGSVCLAASLAMGCGVAISQTVASTSVRFVVAEITPFHHDSYTLVLSSPAQIAHARALITQGPGVGGPIVVARVGVGADGVNRNWRGSGAPRWNWRVIAFEAFADGTIEILDGWPGDVENNPAAWVANTNGSIGFWTYTVVGELPAVANPACPMDVNGDGSLSTQDIFDFLNAWLAGSPSGNFNGESGSTVRDIFDYINAWFAGC